MKRLFIISFFSVAACPFLLYAAPFDQSPDMPPATSVEKSSSSFAAEGSTKPIAPILLTKVPNSAFKIGEKLIFSLKYEFITAGTATMEVSEGPMVDDRPTISIQSRAESNGFVDSFFKVRDFNSSIVDRDALVSWNFHQNLKEGGYNVIRNTLIDYKSHIYTFHRIRKASNTERSGSIDRPVFDILSAFFYARTLPLKLGKRFEITVFSDEDIYQLGIKVSPKLEKVHVAAGRFECFRLEPAILGDGIFNAKEGKMVLWVTDDERKMPVLLRSKVFIGAVDAELASFTPK